MSPDREVSDALWAELAPLLREHATPPPEVVAMGKGLFTWRTIDAELARLVSDSVFDDDRAGVRSGLRAAERPRILAFEADGIEIEVEVVTEVGGRRLLGQLSPGQVAELELHSDGGTVAGTTDRLGRFTLPLPDRPGPLRIRATLTGGRIVESGVAVV